MVVYFSATETRLDLGVSRIIEGDACEMDSRQWVCWSKHDPVGSHGDPGGTLSSQAISP